MSGVRIHGRIRIASVRLVMSITFHPRAAFVTHMVEVSIKPLLQLAPCPSF